MTELLEEVEDGVATLTLNRPERLNAISPGMGEALAQALERLAETPEVDAIVLTGAGRAFCSGGDVKGMSAGLGRTFETRLSSLTRAHRIPYLLHTVPKPTIALVNGVAVGAGMSLALACDFRIAGRSAKLSPGFVKVGLSGDYGGTWFMTRLVGTARARELYLLGHSLEADEALAEGLVNRVVEDAELPAEGRAFAGRFRGGPTLALGYMKRNLNAAETGSLE
jgi:2-(1,2-epoxy-1,2-dihydrophenyl)acetyl-CoA isomerase